MSHRFPNLQLAELVDTLRALQVPVQLSELQTPTPQLVRNIMETFVEPLLGISKEDLRLRDDTLLQQKIILHLSYICSNSDITVRDLVNPISGRVRLMLSSIVNFLLFRENKLELYKKTALEQEQLIDSQNILGEEVTQATACLQQLLLVREEQMPVRKALEEENSALTKELETCFAGQSMLKNEILKHKAEFETSSSQISALSLELQAVREDVERGKQQLLTSPATLNEMSTTLVNEKESLKDVKLRVRQNQQRKECVEKLCSDIVDTNKTVEEAQDVIQKIESSWKAMKENTHSIEASEIKIAELKNVDLHVREKHNILQKKCLSVQNLIEQQKNARRLGVERANQQKQITDLEDRTKSEKTQAQIKEKYRILEQKDAEASKLVLDLTKKYQMLLSCLMAYQTKLNKLAP